VLKRQPIFKEPYEQWVKTKFVEYASISVRSGPSGASTRLVMGQYIDGTYEVTIGNWVLYNGTDLHKARTTYNEA
jgi:hypothetical protein